MVNTLPLRRPQVARDELNQGEKQLQNKPKQCVTMRGTGVYHPSQAVEDISSGVSAALTTAECHPTMLSIPALACVVKVTYLWIRASFLQPTVKTAWCMNISLML